MTGNPTLNRRSLLAGMDRELIRGLNRATVGVFVVDEHRRPCIELLQDLKNLNDPPKG